MKNSGKIRKTSGGKLGRLTSDIEIFYKATVVKQPGIGSGMDKSTE